MSKPTSLLMIQHAGHLTRESVEKLREDMRPIAERLGAEMFITDKSSGVVLQQDLNPLVERLGSLTDAIEQLAQSNMALVEAMYEGDEDAEPRYDLSGKPL